MRATGRLQCRGETLHHLRKTTEINQRIGTQNEIETSRRSPHEIQQFSNHQLIVKISLLRLSTIPGGKIDADQPSRIIA